MSGPFLSFEPITHTLVAVLILLSITALFLFFEFRNRPRFITWRVGAVIIMMAAIAGLLLKPALKTVQSKGVMVLTPNYDPEKADSVLDVHPGLEVFVVAGADPYPGSVLMTSVNELAEVRDQIAFVIGTGLSRDALDILDSASFQFIPAPYPEGIIQLNVPGTIFRNRTHFIEGVIRSTSDESIVLRGPGGKEDSVHIPGKGIHPFRLAFTPKQSGRFTYELSIGSRKEEIPVAVAEEFPIDILMLSDYPTFEGRQLKTFLGEKHHLLIRHRVSRDKFRYEYINRERQSIGRLSEENLSTFDLLIIDTDALRRLSSKEAKDLKESVRDGLGLIVMFNEDPVADKTIKDFVPMKFTRYSRDTARITLNGSVHTVPAWPSAAQATSGLKSLLSTRDRVLSGYISSGFGKIGFQLLQETYGLSLQGDSLAYSTIWSNLIGQTARRASKSFDISCATPFPRFKDTPVTIDVISDGAIPDLYYGDTRMPLAENVNIDDIWTTKLWAGDFGWHSLHSKKDSTRLDFYISREGSWPDLSTANAINENQMRNKKDRKVLTMKEARLPVPPWIFYVMFLLSAGFLWISPKL